MGNLDGFSAEDYEPAAPLSPVPDGDYLVAVVASEVKRTERGSHLALRYQVLDGPHKGRLVFGNITLSNQNLTAQEIGCRQLSALCHACGVVRPGDSSALHGIPITISVAVERRKDTGSLSNKVTAWEAKAPAVAAPIVETPAPAPAPAPKKGLSGPEKAPWQR